MKLNVLNSPATVVLPDPLAEATIVAPTPNAGWDAKEFGADATSATIERDSVKKYLGTDFCRPILVRLRGPQRAQSLAA
jgi:hypothetical protein